MTRALVDAFAGGGAVPLALLGGPAVVPPVGYMGGKRKLATSILGAAGLRPGQGVERVLLVDAGEWGGVWSEVVRDGRGLAERVLAWDGRDPSDLWRELAAAWRPDDPQERAAAYLWLQGRSASCTPVWWAEDGPERLVMSDKPGKRPQAAQESHPGPCGDAVERAARAPKEKGRRSAGSGIMRPSTVAARILCASAALRGAEVRVERRHLAAADVAAWLGTPGDMAGVVVYLDPPYVGATRYGATCPRADVVALAVEHAALGARVLVSEAEALPELLALGWHALDLRAVTGRPGKPEWLTCSEPPDRLAWPAQLGLWAVAS